MKKCYYCAEEIDDNAEDCPYCGHKALNENEKLCPYCSEIIKKDAIYCRFCDNNLDDYKENIRYGIIEEDEIQYDEEEFSIMKFLFSLDGRIGRKEYFTYLGMEFVTAFIMGIVVISMKMSKEQMDVFFGLISLIFLYPNIAVTAKRAHDFNYSAWLSLVTLTPYIGFILMIIVGVIEGNPKENQYGLPKKKV